MATILMTFQDLFFYFQLKLQSYLLWVFITRMGSDELETRLEMCWDWGKPSDRMSTPIPIRGYGISINKREVAKEYS